MDGAFTDALRAAIGSPVDGGVFGHAGAKALSDALIDHAAA